MFEEGFVQPIPENMKNKRYIKINDNEKWKWNTAEHV